MFDKTIVRLLAAAGLATTMLGGVASADVIRPTAAQVRAANPGATSYEIAFVTSQGTTATSTNIADYNQFVTAEANQDPILAGLRVSWHAVASTSTVSAASNAPASGVPVFNTDGQLVTSQNLYAIPLLSLIDDDQFDDIAPWPWGSSVWTGSNWDGSIFTEFPLGGNGSPFPGWAGIGSVSGGAVDQWIQENSAQTSSVLPLYALSSPIPVPEPATGTLLASALLGLGAIYLRRRWAKATVQLLLAAFLVASGVTAHADVFHMPSGQTSLQFVTVGDAGNAADPTQGYGNVRYTYQMGKYDVTVGQYCQFLNAVAKTDTYGLYLSGMATAYPTLGITRSGSPGSYSYAVTGSYSQGVNCPMFDVAWEDAARFCNWLQNGQPTRAEGSGTTESGSYDLNGATSWQALDVVTRSSTATYVIPNENEWYKAAYYKGGGTNAGYWLYPTQSNTAPINTLPDAGNHANFYDYSSTGNHGYTDPTNRLTPVGAFILSDGPYGTYDMGGDIAQCIEADTYDTPPNWRGGAVNSPSYYLESYYVYQRNPNYEDYGMGFRVASVPEPASLALLLAGGFCLLAYAWRRRRQAAWAKA